MASPAVRIVAGIAATALTAGGAVAQGSANAAPPRAQAWIDVATYSGFGMPMGGMGGPGGGASPMSMLGGLLGGGGKGENRFGNTQSAAAGSWVDVTLMTRDNPSLAQAQQAVPAGFLGTPLLLQAPKDVKAPPPERGDDQPEPQEYERPRGKLMLYWGCGATVRPGQPKVLDMSTATPADLGRFFQSRRATTRGTHSAPGRPVWPSPADTRMVPAGASLVGEHAFSGSGVPEPFRFQIPPAQDLMPPLDVQQRDNAGALELSWRGLPTARAYFAAGMGAAGQSEMVIWTSSELPDTGFGLIDYQPNASIDRWLRDKVLLPANATQCTVPKGVFAGEGAMLRVIAYGSELNLAHPPRPADPKVRWEPVWAAKVRVKSVASLMMGMPSMPPGQAPERQQRQPPRMPAAADAPPTDGQAQDQQPQQPGVNPIGVIKGIFGR